MALNKREQTLLWVTITIIVLAVNYFALTRLTKSWVEVSRRLQTRHAEMKAVRLTIGSMPDWRKRYNGLRAGLGERVDRFQSQSDVMKGIEEIGSQSGIVISSRTPLPEVTKDFYREMPVKCNFDATTASAVKFLYSLQTAGGFMTVDQLTITARPDNNGVLRCEIKLRAWAGKTEKPAS